jgi:hypothetical protein
MEPSLDSAASQRTVTGMTPFQVLVLLIWALPAIAAAAVIGRRKGRPWTGFLLGLLLGWIGVIIIAVTSPARAARTR